MYTYKSITAVKTAISVQPKPLSLSLSQTINHLMCQVSRLVVWLQHSLVSVKSGHDISYTILFLIYWHKIRYTCGDLQSPLLFFNLCSCVFPSSCLLSV